MYYFFLVGGWVIYFVLHSVLALDSVKESARRALGNSFRYYRLFYTIISTVGLLSLLIFGSQIKGDYFFQREGVLRYLSFVFTAFGVMSIQLSFRHYSISGFLGFARETGELKVEGILQYIRHPISAGLVLMTIGYFLFIPNLPTAVSCLCILIYLPIGIYLEEKKLMANFGDQYIQYKEKVPAIFPRFGRKTKS